jgi:methylated-DNA-[protein]-cysteine S-methyltransferase
MGNMNDVRKTLKDAASRASAERSTAAAERLTRTAAEHGLADVAYAIVDSPVGALMAAVTPRGLLRLGYDSDWLDRFLAEIAERISPRIVEEPGMSGMLDPLRRQLDEYFEGRRREFDLPLDWRLSHGFRNEVLHELLRVPYGETATYAEMAARAGNPRAYRAAGSACGSNPMPVVVPCHRVVASGGGLGGYGGGIDVKKYLLRLEGALD